MENGIVYDEMDVDLDIDLGPLDSGELQVRSWIATSSELVAPDTSLIKGAGSGNPRDTRYC